MTGLQLRRLDHVSLNVSDRPRSIAWYREALGLDVTSSPETDDDAPVFLGDFGACIALFQAETVSPERERESTGLRHVAFMVGVDELARAQAHLAAQGVQFRFEDHGNAHSLYIPDPDGNVIEVTTYEV